MVEYYKTNGGYFYKKKKNGEIERVAKKVYMKNLMKGGAGDAGGADGGGGGGGGGGGVDGSTGVNIPSMMNKLNWNQYPAVIGTGTHRYGSNALDLYQKYRNTKLPNIMMKSNIDEIAVEYFKFPLFYGNSRNNDRRKEWVSHRKIMDLVLIYYLINKFQENSKFIDVYYKNQYLSSFIQFYTDIFNAINPNFITHFNQIKLSKNEEINKILKEKGPYLCGITHIMRTIATDMLSIIEQQVRKESDIESSIERFFIQKKKVPNDARVTESNKKNSEYNKYQLQLDLFFIKFLIEKFNADSSVIILCIHNKQFKEFIDLYEEIFNILCPEFVTNFKKVQSNLALKKKSEEDEQKRQKLNLILQENLKEFFQQKIQNLNDYMQLLEELYLNINLRTTKINEIDRLIAKYRQILAILQP